MIYKANQIRTNDVGLDFAQPRHWVTPQMELETRAMGNKLESSFAMKTELGKNALIAPKDGAEPQFILFVKDACPCSIDAQPIFNTLATRYKDHVTFLGVIDGNEQTAKKFASECSVPYPVIGDRDLKVIRSFGAQGGVYSALVARNGHLIKMWPGYSADLLQEMNHYLAKASGVSETHFDPQYAPKQKAAGCAYPVEYPK